jgi:hypothetical protein
VFGVGLALRSAKGSPPNGQLQRPAMLCFSSAGSDSRSPLSSNSVIRVRKSCNAASLEHSSSILRCSSICCCSVACRSSASRCSSTHCSCASRYLLPSAQLNKEAKVPMIAEARSRSIQSQRFLQVWNRAGGSGQHSGQGCTRQSPSSSCPSGPEPQARQSTRAECGQPRSIPTSLRGTV